jgi:hypothetical protein
MSLEIRQRLSLHTHFFVMSMYDSRYRDYAAMVSSKDWTLGWSVTSILRSVLENMILTWNIEFGQFPPRKSQIIDEKVLKNDTFGGKNPNKIDKKGPPVAIRW